MAARTGRAKIRKTTLPALALLPGIPPLPVMSPPSSLAHLDYLACARVQGGCEGRDVPLLTGGMRVQGHRVASQQRDWHIQHDQAQLEPGVVRFATADNRNQLWMQTTGRQSNRSLTLPRAREG